MATPSPSLFISYRRDDSAGYARALAEALGQRHGAARVFIDADDIRAGQRFGTTIEQALADARVVLVLIGRRWAAERGADLPPRLHDADDLVRHEVARALARPDTTVLPLLLDGTPMPEAAQLPPDLQALTGLHALSLGTATWGPDCQRLMAALDPLMGPPSVAQASDIPRPPAPRRRSMLTAVAVAAAVATLAWQVLAPQIGTPTDRPPTGAPGRPAPATAAAALAGAWQAPLSYGWLPQPRTERLDLLADGEQLRGSIGFLGVARPVEEATRLADGQWQLVTRSTEQLGDSTRTLTHRYLLQAEGDTLRGTLQTTGGHAPQPPVPFTARRP